MKQFFFAIILMTFSALVSANQAFKETNPLVLEGNFTRLKLDDVLAQLDDLSQEKPLFIYVGSDGYGCGYCDKAQKVLHEYRTSLDPYFKYIYIGFENWTKLHDFPRVRDKLLLIGLPHYVVYYQGGIKYYQQGLIVDKKRIEYFEAAAQWQIKKNGASYVPHMKAWKDYFIMDHHNKSQIINYGLQDKHKAVALAAEGRKYSLTYSHGKKTQQEANQNALEKCDQSEIGKKIGTCKLIITGNIVAQNSFPTEIENELIDLIHLSREQAFSIITKTRE